MQVLLLGLFVAVYLHDLTTAVNVVEGGQVVIQTGGVEKTVHLTRAHLEEDAGKSLHEDYQGMTGIDLNRAGTPLLEIVTEPDMRSAKEAVAYARKIHSLVRSAFIGCTQRFGQSLNLTVITRLSWIPWPDSVCCITFSG